MSVPKICALLEQKLLAMSPAMPTAFENKDFYPSTEAPTAPYQRASHLINTPRDLAITADITEWRGIFQVMVCAPLGKGRGEAQARAQLIADHFVQPQNLAGVGVRVDLLKEPAVGSGYRDAERWCVPVSITWSAFKT